MPSYRQKAAKKATTPAAKGGATETTGLMSVVDKNGNADRSEIHEVYNLPPRSWGYSLFVIFSSLCVLVTGMMVLAQVTNLAFLGNANKGGIIQDVLRVYTLLFCVMFILSELRFEQFLKLVPPLKNWFYRGFLYSFVGVIGVEESYAALAEEYPQIPGLKEQTASLFLKITSYAMFSIGILYMAMGLLCLKGVMEKLKNNYEEQVKNWQPHQGDTSIVV